MITAVYPIYHISGILICYIFIMVVGCVNSSNTVDVKPSIKPLWLDENSGCCKNEMNRALGHLCAHIG